MQMVVSSCVDAPAPAPAFRDAMAALGAAVSVVTTDGPAGRHGMTATAVCSLSDQPASLLVCVNRSSRMHDVLARNGVFCVNVLAAGQEELSRLFADPARTMEDRFDLAGDLMEMSVAAPGLAAAQISVACAVTMMIEASTHSVVMGEVRQIVRGQGEGGLVYYGRRYHALA